ncbi:hypothetical protein [Amycolatopsis rubida]|uniref:Uncharacterized protein n=1 Tax=Amycolatopsis rubida TaxID=112413 RepID=A0A1I5X5R6_9PSEU|nr:hypothetical protein [Amycolatopsis rubida]SFQ27284.1 hypothetical protein SAMN05421854_11046 [Amycolatopsis rubida]
MTSYDEQKWRERSVEEGCREAEARVADTRATVVGCQVAAAIGFLLVVVTAYGFFGDSVPMRVIITLLGSVLIGFGLDTVGRIRGQRQIAQWWRTSLERPMPTDDDPAV